MTPRSFRKAQLMVKHVGLWFVWCSRAAYPQKHLRLLTRGRRQGHPENCCPPLDRRVACDEVINKPVGPQCAPMRGKEITCHVHHPLLGSPISFDPCAGLRARSEVRPQAAATDDYRAGA